MSILYSLLDVLAAFALIAVLLGLFHRSVMQVVTESLAPLRRGIDALAAAASRTRDRISSAMTSTLMSLELGGENWKPSYLVGPLVITGFLAIFALCEYEMIVLTLAALGEWWKVPSTMLDMTSLLAFALITNAFFSLWMVGELRGRAFLVPAHQLGAAERLLLTRLSATAAVLSFALIPALAGFRADSMLADAAGGQATSSSLASIDPLDSSAGDPMALLSPVDGPAPREVRPMEAGATVALMVGAPVALSLSGAVAFDAGFLQLVKLIPLGVLAVIRILLTLASTVVACLGAALSLLYGPLIALLAWVQKIGITLARPAVSLVRLTCDSARSPNGLNSLWVEALTSWAYDLEVPTDPVGNRYGIDGPEVPEMATVVAADDGLPAGFDATNQEPEAATADEASGAHVNQDDAGAASNTETPSADVFATATNRNFDPFGTDSPTDTGASK